MSAVPRRAGHVASRISLTTPRHPTLSVCPTVCSRVSSRIGHARSRAGLACLPTCSESIVGSVRLRGAPSRRTARAARTKRAPRANALHVSQDTLSGAPACWSRTHSSRARVPPNLDVTKHRLGSPREGPSRETARVPRHASPAGSRARGGAAIAVTATVAFAACRQSVNMATSSVRRAASSSARSRATCAPRAPRASGKKSTWFG